MSASFLMGGAGQRWRKVWGAGSRLRKGPLIQGKGGFVEKEKKESNAPATEKGDPRQIGGWETRKGGPDVWSERRKQ